MFTKRNFVVILYLLLFFYVVTVLSQIYISEKIVDYVDIPLHILGGFVFAFAEVVYFKEFLPKQKGFWPRLFVILFIVGGSALIGVLWEHYEWLHDHFLAIPQHLLLAQPDLADTMKDLLNDLLGGVAVAILYLNKRQ